MKEELLVVLRVVRRKMKSKAHVVIVAQDPTVLPSTGTSEGPVTDTVTIVEILVVVLLDKKARGEIISISDPESDGHSKTK